jgi:anti-sigma B factor antagonist
LDTLIDNSWEKRGIRLVLDLGDVQHVTSAALASLINLKKNVVGVSGKLRIENLHPDLFEVFRITCLDRAFDNGR